jgi:uncharacterized protein YciI
MPEFLVLSNLMASREKLQPYRDKHLSYLEELKKKGQLLLAGRFADGSGGAYILTADSMNEAKEIADNDPYHSSGLRSYIIKEWERRF